MYILVYIVYTHRKYTYLDRQYIIMSDLDEKPQNNDINAAYSASESSKELEIDLNQPLNAVVIEQPTVNGEPTTTPKKRRKRAESAKVIEEAHAVKQTPSNVVLSCECGADIMPDKSGMYPARCPNCGTWNDYRGLKFLEQSQNILVCDKCGGLTLLKPDTVCCEHCGAR